MKLTLLGFWLAALSCVAGELPVTLVGVDTLFAKPQALLTINGDSFTLDEGQPVRGITFVQLLHQSRVRISQNGQCRELSLGCTTINSTPSPEPENFYAHSPQAVVLTEGTYDISSEEIQEMLESTGQPLPANVDLIALARQVNELRAGDMNPTETIIHP